MSLFIHYFISKIIYSNFWKLKSKSHFIIVNTAYSLYYIYFQFKRKIYKNTYFQAILYGKNTFHNTLSTAGLDIFPRNWNIYITMYKIVLKENLEFNAKKSYLKKLKNNLKLYLWIIYNFTIQNKKWILTFLYKWLFS